MPTLGYGDPIEQMERLRRAKARVRAKFPLLIEGSSGWYRALKVQRRKP